MDVTESAHVNSRKGLKATAQVFFQFLSQDKYIVYLVLIALAGWSLASYDVNLLVLALPDIARELHISETMLGVLGFVVYGAQFFITLCAGSAMDAIGRRKVWMFCLTGCAVFTGLTFFVQNFWQLAIVRALASGFAYSELAVSITIVNEQVPARYRGFLYSIVQGGWPIGVFLASAVYLVIGDMGWRVVFLLGVVPVVMVMIGRKHIKESERYEHVQALKDAQQMGNNTTDVVAELQSQHQVDTRDLNKTSIRQLFSTAGYVRRQLILLSVIWIIYAISIVPSNFYITYWLQTYKHFTTAQTSMLLAVSGILGFFFYVLGGLLGEVIGRKKVQFWTAVLIPIFGFAFYYSQDYWLICLVYFCLYQVTNGTWSGAGFAYIGESFPTRIRGTAVGFISAMLVLGYMLGSLVWTVCTSILSPHNTWMFMAVIMPLGLFLTLFLKDIKPGTELEDIAT
ncbi:MFS transporter [Acinetobacter sp. MD2(2019)]|uniref:MFS transporter n=1 Tax=Acinetobacter sp. MD2(2019) TaxID=2605273 RepID=UPI002D1EA929|nr:MFS transporter [Acinetobacter sp. MD2(2019)]MEB3752758.1 MFS transporter [Acinetobacter sp. MD2(2019)]